MPDDADDEIQFVPVQAFEGHRAALGGTMVAPIASRALKLAIAGIVTVLAIAATLVLVFHEDIDREFGPGPATRPWSAQELEAWLPPEYEEQARKVAGQRTTVVGVRCESYDSVTSLDLPRDRVFRAIEALGTDAFACEVRAVTGQAESTKHLCGVNGVRNRDGRGETAPTLFEGECPEDS